MFDRKSLKFKFIIASLITVSNVWFYNWLGPVEGFAIFIALFNIPVVQSSMVYFEFKKNYIHFSIPKDECLKKVLQQTSLMIMALCLLKMVCLPHLTLFRSTISWNIAFLYCFISVPLQVWIVRGCLQTAVHDILFELICLVKDIKDDMAEDFSFLFTNLLFLFYHLNYGVGFSVASFVAGLFWSDMSVINAGDSNLVYPLISHIIVGFFAFSLSFDQCSQALVSMNLPIAFAFISVMYWARKDARFQWSQWFQDNVWGVCNTKFEFPIPMFSSNLAPVCESLSRSVQEYSDRFRSWVTLPKYK